MRAMQIIEWGKPLEARDYPDPEPQGEEVLLRVEAAGVCHSDVHIWDGHFDLGGGQQISLESRGVRLPFTMGHEIAGEVAALGPRASGVKVGDKVVAYPWIGCGECAVCRKGEELLCLNPRTPARGETPRHARPATRLRRGAANAARQLDAQRVSGGKRLDISSVGTGSILRELSLFPFPFAAEKPAPADGIGSSNPLCFSGESQC